MIGGSVSIPETHLQETRTDEVESNRDVLSYRGPGIGDGLKILQAVKDETGLPILSDIHDVSQVELAAKVLDILQIPAFLSRQTDLLVAAGKTGKIINIKKGQFQAPWDMQNAIGKVSSTGNDQILLTERGASFGYNNLVSDMRSLVIMRQTGYPVPECQYRHISPYGVPRESSYDAAPSDASSA